MKNKCMARIAALSLTAALLSASCQDDLPKNGASLAQGEVAIEVDSLFTLTGRSSYAPVFDSRSTTNLLGRISVPEYGDLNCSFVAQMMSAPQMNIPDSIGVERVDSMVMILTVPRGSLTGDSVAPQQLRLYELTKSLPADIMSNFDATGYYTPQSLLGKRSFTLSGLSLNDSLFKKTKYISLPVRLSDDFARKVFTDYRTNPAPFQWPETFAKYFAGIYVDTSFGSGCIANISKANAVLYYYHLASSNQVVDGQTVTTVKHVKDSITLFSTVPEVLSSNNIRLNIADALKNRAQAGETIIVSPGGYNVDIEFPLQQILDRYSLSDKNVSVVNDLTFQIPASSITNDYGISMPPTLLMVPKDKAEEFFAKNQVPDNKTTFWAAYNSDLGAYVFSSMRDYLLEAVAKRGTDEQVASEFTLIPVTLTTQEKYVSYNQTTTLVTSCTPYITRPAMCRLRLDDAKIKFTFSLQTLE